MHTLGLHESDLNTAYMVVSHCELQYMKISSKGKEKVRMDWFAEIVHCHLIFRSTASVC